MRVCAEENVTSAMLYPSMSKEKELLVVGVGADEGVQDKLKHKMKQYFPEFTITTNNIKTYTDHTRPYAKSLMAVKELSRENKTYRVVSEATCELILEATDPTHGDNIPRLYAFVSAHFVLDEPEQELLKQSNVHENADKHVRQTTTGKNLDNLYSLSLLMPRKHLPVYAHDVIFSYRPYRRPEEDDQGPSHFSSFYGDACLLQIDEASINFEDDKIISKEELSSAMQERPDQKKIGDILPVTDAKDIIGMATKKVKIEVGPSSGYMILPGRALKSKKAETSRPQLHHIQFVIMDWNLLPGHSGSIVYVVDAKTQLRYRLGVLFGECNRQTDQKVFQAIVLHQAITELETRYGDKVQDLKPMHNDAQALGTKDPAAIRSRLVKHSEPSKDLSKREHLERKSEVRHAMNSTAISDDTSFSSKKDESLSLDSDMNSLSSSLNPKFDPSNSPSPIQKVTTGYQSPDVSGYYTGASNFTMNTDDE
ncbi:uncharacterized protein [Watersipora subatra]|uniref:uncharacterized protein isoform X2 n=1 Tax=Watersipora subatra TaxID=2589382 RepID=UPI00355AF1C3